MRPYQLFPKGAWVDLDAVQAIEPPYTSSVGSVDVARVELTVWFAFRDAPQTWAWGQENDAHTSKGYREYKPHLTAEGVPTELDRVTREVYEPLLKAWSAL